MSSGSEEDLLSSAVEEFSVRSIDPVALNIERSGIDANMIGMLAAQGFLGAMASAESGGAGLDKFGYSRILLGTASHSPSVSALVMITNSIFTPLIQNVDPELLKRVVSGEERFCVAISNDKLSGNELSVEGNRISGRVLGVVNPSERNLIVNIGEDIFLVRSGFKITGTSKPLSFRGLGSGTVTVDSSDIINLTEKTGITSSSILDSLDYEVSCIAIGMSKGAIDKVLDYVKVRKTFDKPLKDYSPVANTLSRLLSEETLLMDELDNIDPEDKRKVLMLKLRSEEFSKEAAKYSIQFHGGYGFFEDFGVEKFYRDSFGLPILFSNYEGDKLRLSSMVFGDKSGYI
ncbi:MAG: acyl-CoA/acyl-ACP dehydrogenase [Thermoplasmatales archaeon]|nr:acyl-CoA/acyl-ACP dehydrogenase [Thermoplasmatales archaeon]